LRNVPPAWLCSRGEVAPLATLIWDMSLPPGCPFASKSPEFSHRTPASPWMYPLLQRPRPSVRSRWFWRRMEAV